MMESVSLAEAKAHLSELVERAAAGDAVCITRRGKPVAQIAPLDKPKKATDAGPRALLTCYLDTSVLVAALTTEAQTRRMQTWLIEQEPGGLAISEWVATEFSAALSVKLRTGKIDATDRADTLAVFARLRAEDFTILPVSALHFRTAARLADQHSHGLRAGDALHLAICAEHGATLCTLDRRQGEAGVALGVKTKLL
jgi:uncharacterized protein